MSSLYRVAIICAIMSPLLSIHAMDRSPSPELGLSPEASMSFCRRNISVDRAQINNHDNKSVSNVYVMQQPDPQTIAGSLQRGFLNGLQGVATSLTTQTIMQGLQSGAIWTIEKFSGEQSKLDQKTFGAINALNEKIAALTLLQDITEDKEVAAGYATLIKKHKDEIESILKKHLVIMQLQTARAA